MEGDGIRALRKWLRERPQTALDFVFVSERGSPLARQSARCIVAEAGRRAVVCGLQPMPSCDIDNCAALDPI